MPGGSATDSEGEAGPGGTDGSVGPDTSDDADGSGSDGSDATASGTSGGPTVSAPVDFLFVIDDTASMGPVQRRLQEAMPAFASALQESGLDFHIGVTSTDNGNYWCTTTTSEAGALVASSCRARIGDFTFMKNDESDRACLDVCSLDAVDTDVPWIEGQGEDTNLGAVALTEALQCRLPQGVAGCGFEQQLESMYKALERSDVEDTGFIRNDASLVVIFVSDEADCSYNAAWETIFLSTAKGGNQVFWSDPKGIVPTSAICWNAGVTCTGSVCTSQDKDVAGNPTGNEDNAVMWPVARYADQLTGYLDAKSAMGATVLVYGMLGVPLDYDGSLAYTSNDTTSVDDYGIDPACAGGPVEGIPPVRMREVAESVGPDAGARLFSVCANDYSAAFIHIIDSLVDQLG